MVHMFGHAIFHSLYENLHWVTLSATVALTGWKVSLDVYRGGNFIADVLTGSGITRAVAYKKMLWAFLRSKTLFLDFGARRLAAARYIAELEILLPDISKPDAIDYDPADYKAILAQWQRVSQERSTLKLQLFQKYFDSRRLTVLKWLLRLVADVLFRSDKSKPPVASIIPINDIPALDSSRHLIKHYFDTLAAVLEEENKTFIATAEFRMGYLAPQFLITGLISRFGDEEGWKLILDNYRRLIKGDVAAYSRELVELRSFLFNCWLLWGPSISPCTCGTWRAEDQSDALILQYGYGDENNSIDVLIKRGATSEKVRSIKDALNSLQDTEREAPFNPIAKMSAPYCVKGTFNWGPALADTVPEAQRLIQGGKLRNNPMNGRIVLECEAENVVPSGDAHASKYYSAYIWVMFRIVTFEGKSFFPDARWKDLLVFFEHGNTADATTFQTLKEGLVAKACSALTEILERPADREKLRIEYVCSLDHSYCEPRRDVVFPPQEGVPGKGAGFGGVLRPARIFEIVLAHIKRLPEGHVLKSSRLSLPKGNFPPEVNPLSSCHLPEVVEEFYRDLKRQSVVNAADVAATIEQAVGAS